MFHSFQMEKPVNVKKCHHFFIIHAELFQFFFDSREVEEDFSRTLRKREGKDVGRLVFGPKRAVESARSRVPTKD